MCETSSSPFQGTALSLLPIDAEGLAHFGPATGAARALPALGEPVLPLWHEAHTDNEAFASRMLLSASDGVRRARVTGLTLDSRALREGHWQALLPALRRALLRLARHFDRALVWYRLEWPCAVRAWSWRALQKELKRYKRGYYRAGLAFATPGRAPLMLGEMELNANACLYPGRHTPHARINQARLERYIEWRCGTRRMPDFDDDLPVWSFLTAGVFFEIDDAGARLFTLDSQTRSRGRRATPPLSVSDTGALIARSTRFLGRQVGPQGDYEYGYLPCFDRRVEGYNVLRHASSTYALLEGYETCAAQGLLDGEALARLRRQILWAIEGLERRCVVHREKAAYVVDTGDTVKLGANAVAILALVKYREVTGDERYAALAAALALGIAAMQTADGSFVHVLDAGDLSVRERYRIIYYDGEAAFALMRLYAQSGDTRWLDCVVRAFDHFIEHHHERAHDHWLAYCANELVKHRPERRYFAFAIRNVAGHVDFIRERITTFPTLLELAMAFHQTLCQLKSRPEWSDLLEGFDVEAFYRALHARANHLQNGFFWPEVAMYFKAPASVADSFFIRHHGFRVRIDDVEHYLSGLVAYREMLREMPPVPAAPPPFAGMTQSEAVAAATGGVWVNGTPDRQWRLAGLCCWPGAFQPGQVVVARGGAMTQGFLPPAAVKALVARGAGAVMCDDESLWRDIGVPVLRVANVQSATLALGEYRRRHFEGRVAGVTGSAGKSTTVAMMAHALAGQAQTGQSQGSANLPVGIAWNLASMPPRARYWVVEMAIGAMARNAALVRPDIAIVTNIAAAHLAYHTSLAGVACKKARILTGMAPGGLVVLYRDMAFYRYFQEQARRRRLRVVSFGEHPDADLRLIDFDGTEARVAIRGEAQSLPLCLGATGRHMLHNALAVLAVAREEGLSLDGVLARLRAFQAIPGRGEIRELIHRGRAITVTDDAYNANPLSMRMALEAFAAHPAPARQKVVILGDMLELGERAEAHHLELLPLLSTLSVRSVLLCGAHCQTLATRLAEARAGVVHFADARLLKARLEAHLQSQDLVLVKASHGVGLHALFDD